MDVVSLCALRASAFGWQPRFSTYALTVICKATFELRPNECVLAPEQEDPSDAEAYWNDDARRSVVVPSDRAPYKPRADVVLVGHAYAPKQKPARSLMTRLLVGEIDKSIEVWCDRGVRTHTGQLLEGQRQAKMRITWERAAGGPETNNPVGMRFDAPPDRYGMVAIPNMQPPGVHFSKPGDTFVPVGYGPIAPHWPERTQKLYRHAASFAASSWEEQPLPEPFDYGYFNVAPRDQQVAELRPNERLVLENLHPQHERLVTSLPGIRPRAIADRATGEREEIALLADTLWIDTDRGICTVVWRGRIGLRHPQEPGRVAFWVDGLTTDATTSSAPRQDPVSSSVEGRQEEKVEDGTITITIAPGQGAGMGMALPFVRGAPAPPSLVGISAAAPPPWLGPLATATKLDDGTGTIIASMIEPAKDPLPFAHVVGAPPRLAGAPAAWPVTARERDDEGTGTVAVGLDPADMGAGQSMPFQTSLAAAPPPQAMFIPAAAPAAFAMEEEPETPREKRVAAREAAEKAQVQEVAPPPMIGPIPVAEMAAVVEEKPKGTNAKEIAPAILVPNKPAAAVEEKPRPEDFPLERCAALTARIARSKPDKARILEEEKLSAGHWAAIEKHWADAIRNETRKGKKRLLDRFDAAYVKQLEKERGTIEVQDYAKLMVATERGTTDEVLEELGLPRGALMRIERVWIMRLITNPSLDEQLGQMVEDARAR